MNNKYLELRGVLSDMGLNTWTIVRDTWTGRGVCVFDKKGMDKKEFERFKKYTSQHLTTPLERADGYDELWGIELYAYFLPEYSVDYVRDIELLRDYADDMYGLKPLDSTYDVESHDDTCTIDEVIEEWIVELEKEKGKEESEGSILDDLLYDIAVELLSEGRSEENISNEEAEDIFDWFFGVNDEDDEDDDEDDDDSWYW